MMRTPRHIAIARPSATPGMAPRRNPATIRQSVTTVSHGNSPETQSSQNRSTMSVGSGTKRRSPKPAMIASCHKTSNPIGDNT